MTSTIMGMTRSHTRPFGVVHGLGRFDVLLAGGEEVALCNGVVFMLFHGAVVKFGNGHEYHHDNGEQRIEVVGEWRG